MLDKNVAAISTTVALKAVCAMRGVQQPQSRAPTTIAGGEKVGLRASLALLLIFIVAFVNRAPLMESCFDARYADCMRIFPRLTVMSLCHQTDSNGFSQSNRSPGGFTLPSPPEVQSTPVTDDYFGTKIVDNYPSTKHRRMRRARRRRRISMPRTDTPTVITKQDRIYSQIPDQLGALMDVTETGYPVERNGNFFFMRRLGGEQQYSIYFRHEWTGKDVRLLDPAVISRDPNTSISLDDVSRDGTLFLYSEKQGGTDEAGLFTSSNVNTKKDPRRRIAQHPLFFNELCV